MFIVLFQGCHMQKGILGVLQWLPHASTSCSSLGGWRVGKQPADPEPAVSFSRGPCELQLLGAGPGPCSGGQKGPSIQGQLTTPAVFSVTCTGTKGPL